MNKRFSTFQRRFGSARPGLQLIAVEDAAIPVTVVRADVLAQERKELPITEEFALRYVHSGVEHPSDIAAFLGLDVNHVLEAAAELLGEQYLRRRGGGDILELTPVGLEVVRNLAATKPILRQLPISFDRLTWTLANYPEHALIAKKDALEAGMTVLPADRNSRIGLDDVTAAEFNRLLKATTKERLQVLRIHKVAATKHRYLPVELLVYGDERTSELELAVCVDDELSAEHGIALERTRAVEQLGLKLEPSAARPLLEAELESQRAIVEVAGLPDAESEQNNEGAGAGAVDGQKHDPDRSGFTQAPVRSVSVFEHADLLADALDTVKARLLIISPWVKSAVITTDFIARLEMRLRANVAVTIAHGIGEDDRGSDESALRRLSNLSDRYENFTFVRLANTHAKILIADDQWVNTSFNWLSFRGDPDRTYRMEEGTLVSIPNRVQAEYEKYLAMIQEQGRKVAGPRKQPSNPVAKSAEAKPNAPLPKAPPAVAEPVPTPNRPVAKPTPPGAQPELPASKPRPAPAGSVPNPAQVANRKRRVHELARELGVSTREIIASCNEQGIFVKSASSVLEPAVVKKVRGFFANRKPGE